MAQYEHSLLPPKVANPNQLAQQLGGVNLADSSNPHAPQIYFPTSGNASLIPGTYPPGPPMSQSNLHPWPKQPQALLQDHFQPIFGLMPQTQQQLGSMFPYQFQNSNELFDNPQPPVSGGFPPQTPGFQGQSPMSFHPQQSHHLAPQQQPGYDSMGYPTTPGYTPEMSGPILWSSPQPAVVLPQQRPRRIDPKQIPNPIKVMEDDKRSRSGPFPTNLEGLIVAELPPLVTTQFVTRDQGNSNPRFVRSSMYR